MNKLPRTDWDAYELGYQHWQTNRRLSPDDLVALPLPLLEQYAAGRQQAWKDQTQQPERKLA